MKIQTFLVCDDIRNEIGNKHSLIGVYDEGIIFNVTADKKDFWPRQIKLGVFIRINNENDHPCSFDFIIKYNDNKKLLVKGKINKKIKDGKTNKTTLVFVFNSFVFEQAGYIKFIFDFFDAEGKKIKTLIPDFNFEVKEIVNKKIGL